MNVAKIELCRELYELSGWFDTSQKYNELGEVVGWKPFTSKKHTPAYDLGFLQRKLRDYAEDYNGEKLEYILTSNEPENDMARVAIKLHKQGILRRETQK